MIRYHESFSTRIFLPAAPAVKTATTSTDLREFWWFLRTGGSRAPVAPAPAARPGRASHRPQPAPAKG